ncbi:PIN domain-containing protein [Bordetella genomosp. 1]|uniref:PIN domain-containing protein n=1 Tax=Bordetella genomosp. 1 TaxID=1395607 RepID=A0ABX4F2V5_9BORD|nr:PIN domain-containing protein [Bordetella genomosp. 1]OZI68077.1 PIN domain-containing protein [Bordetella genomosp. 1]
MTVPVVADADTLFAATTRGLLIYLDYQGVIRLHWSSLILDELNRALVQAGRKPTLAAARAHATRMCEALPHALVPTRQVQARFEAVAPAVRSAKDMHVAACAHHLVAAAAYGASPVALVTRNTRDFVKTSLAQLGIALQTPDAFLETLLLSRARDVAAAFRRFRIDLNSQPDPDTLLRRLALDGQARSARRLRRLQLAGEVAL